MQENLVFSILCETYMLVISDLRTTIMQKFVLVHLQFTEIWCKINVGVFHVKHSVITTITSKQAKKYTSRITNANYIIQWFNSTWQTAITYTSTYWWWFAVKRLKSNLVFYCSFNQLKAKKITKATVDSIVHQTC